jgi:hypothetical protein
MTRGLYRDNAGWVQVDYDDKFHMPMKKGDYEDHGYKPRYESLPMKQTYEKAAGDKASGARKH